MRWRVLVFIVAAIGVAIVGRAGPFVVNAGKPTVIKNQYIVVMERGTTPTTLKQLAGQVVAPGGKPGGTVLFLYPTLPGFAVRLNEGVPLYFPPGAAVAFVEADEWVRLADTQPPPLGIDRTDQRLLPLDDRFQHSEDGTGVHVYVIDSGINTGHPDFTGRATGARSLIANNTADTDVNGHGTHIAGTIGGATYGIARNALLHSVRVAVNDTTADSTVIAGVDWVTSNAIHPAVANLSIDSQFPSPALEQIVRNSIASGVTYVVAAGNYNDDACVHSPSAVPEAITVGAINPKTDKRMFFSSYGSCVDLFAPGLGIVSASGTSGSRLMNGTSMAAAHVSGVAALALQLNPNASPATVWSMIEANDDVSTTSGWSGVHDLAQGTTAVPNELLHWGPLRDGYDDGDPHLTTVDGTHYNFQAAGEFVLLRDGSMEIQTRQTPVATTTPDPPADPYDGLATCVSLNTAVAARVGTHRVTYDGVQLRIDGVVTPLTPQGTSLSGGGRVSLARVPAGDAAEIDFQNGTVLMAVRGWWASQNRAYLNVDVSRTHATEGLLGEHAPEWSAAAMPASLHQRYVDLYQTFADKWRVTPQSSLFDYEPGTSTATFTLSSWPGEHPPCLPPGMEPVRPAAPALAREVCSQIDGERARVDCVFDVTITGNTGFAQTYLASQQLHSSATVVTLSASRDTSLAGERVTFSAAVTSLAFTPIPTGTVQLYVDGGRSGAPRALDSHGRAQWSISLLGGAHHISAQYAPAGSPLLPSTSPDLTHTVRGRSINETMRKE